MADDPLDSSPTDWAPPPIKLVPVDHDPFNDAWTHGPLNHSAAGGSPFDGPSFWTPSLYKPGQSFALQSEPSDLSAIPSEIIEAASAAGIRNHVADGSGSPINWATPSIRLVPIDHDPFSDSSVHAQFNTSWATGRSGDPSWMLPFSVSGQSIAPQGGLGDPTGVPNKAESRLSAADRNDVTIPAGAPAAMTPAPTGNGLGGVLAEALGRTGDLASQGVSRIKSGLSQLGAAHPPPAPLPPWLDAIIQAQPQNKAVNERTWQKIQGIGDVLGGAFKVAFSPSGMISVPLERAGGTFPNGEPQIPKEVTEFGLGLVGPSVLGGAARLSRLSKGIKLAVGKPPVGELPKTADTGNLDPLGSAPLIGSPESEPAISPLLPSKAQAPSPSFPPQTSPPALGSISPAQSDVGSTFASDPNWRRLIENIDRVREAWAEGGGKLPAAISGALPKYERQRTYGMLITNEGDVVPLRSGSPIPLYGDYVSSKHVEGRAAIWIREHGSTGGVVYHNNTTGTCGFCTRQAATLLPEGARLWIVPPADAFPKNSRATGNLTSHLGDASVPEPPAQYDFFSR